MCDLGIFQKETLPIWSTHNGTSLGLGVVTVVVFLFGHGGRRVVWLRNAFRGRATTDQCPWKICKDGEQGPVCT